MKHSQVITHYSQILMDHGMEEQEAQTEVKHALAKLEKCDIPTLFLKAQLPVSESVEYRLKAIVDRRITGEPLAYILKERWFMGLPFYVTPDVLIPRQETEMLAETAIQLIRLEAYARILDICTGSGCIAVSIARYTRAKVSASDISAKALEVALKNAQTNLVNISFFESDLFEAAIGQFDLITANPPYISKTEIETLQTEVIDHEPRLALVAEDNGLAFYKRIAKDAPRYLTPRGTILLEIGNEQGPAVKKLFEKSGFRDVRVQKDYSGLDRMIIAKNYVKPEKKTAPAAQDAKK
ncbi:MAG: peptide chain release factor N(5)-glutamine methyltransferase [Christensenellaceae bacterium]|nr:peptide chain release factor N(5)-glutamine methyltransferase [Christensenellaceae bacterium]